MSKFINDYPDNKTIVLAATKQRADQMHWSDAVDDEMVYRQIASGEFQLYQEIIFCTAVEESPRASISTAVA